MAERPEDILLAVVGGVGRKSTYLPSRGATRAVTRPVAMDYQACELKLPAGQWRTPSESRVSH